jgi:hypothetical protein
MSALLKDDIHIVIEAPANGTIVLIQKLTYNITVTGIITKTSTGTITTTINDDGGAISGCTSNVTSSEDDITMITAHDVDAGETVSLVLTSNSSAANLTVTVKARKRV